MNKIRKIICYYDTTKCYDDCTYKNDCNIKHKQLLALIKGCVPKKKCVNDHDMIDVIHGYNFVINLINKKIEELGK